MPVAKLYSSGTVNAMKSEEGNDSLDILIRQAIGKDPLLPFSKTGDSPVQLIQLLHALDQPDLPGWPLLTPPKVQMQKCEKCSREYCSPINYRRHIRVHRRSLNVNKEWHKNRDLLATFWDELSLEEAKEVVAFDDVMLKGIPGSSVVRALASSLRKPGIWTLPPVYLKAGTALLEIIQAKPCRLPISSRELFSILDHASEWTFLCAGTADSVQRYVFDGETAKNSLELKNLVASTSFLFEQQLVKAWLADKDAEALRCQKLLVEEEEAAQKRQAALLERKRLKKLRQKEQKVKEQFNEHNSNLNVDVDEVNRPDSTEESGPSSPSDSNSNLPDMPSNLESMQFQSKESDENTENSEHINQWDTPQITEAQMGPTNGHRHSATTRWQVPKPQRGGRYGLYASQNHQVLKSEPVHKFGRSKDRALMNKNQVWTKKVKVNCDSVSVKPPSLQEKTSHQIEENNCELIIGSISVTLKSYIAQNEAQYTTCSTKHAMFKNNSEKPITNREASKHWMPVSHGETKSISMVDKGNEDYEGGAMLEKVHVRTQSGESSIQSECMNDDDRDNQDTSVLSEENAQQGNLPFSREAAKEFLAQRWKEAIAGDHVELVLSSGPKRSDEHFLTDLQERSAVGNPDKQFGRNGHNKFRKKPEKSTKIKYIPKQKTAA